MSEFPLPPIIHAPAERPSFPSPERVVKVLGVDIPRSIAPVITELTRHDEYSRLIRGGNTPLVLSTLDTALISYGVPLSRFDLIKSEHIQSLIDQGKNDGSWNAFESWYKQNVSSKKENFKVDTIDGRASLAHSYDRYQHSLGRELDASQIFDQLPTYEAEVTRKIKDKKIDLNSFKIRDATCQVPANLDTHFI